MRLVVVEFMTLDGVMEAPGYEEHRTGRNGWALEVGDPELQAFNEAQVSNADALLFGRTTFNVWAAFWPTAPEVAAPTARHLTGLPKYVVSKTLRDPDWANTFVLRGELETEIRRITAGAEGDLVVYGSAELVGGLLELDLVDELRLALFPVVLGSGKRLFREETELRRFGLVSSVATSSGVLLLTYERRRDRGAPDAGAWDLQWTDAQTDYFRAAEDTERVLATVMFTDIVDSTGRAAVLGDREWRRLLDRHDETTRAEVKRWGGQLVTTTGDGILARFEAPTRALRCAFAVQSAMARLGLELRVAIHTGEIEVRGDDIGGIGVHIASRALATAGPGRVVVTRTVRDLATGADLEFRALGPVTLRGVPDPWELFEASARRQ
jgi:class 3 adenylate cyclase